MSTIFDIKAARYRLTMHVSFHGCETGDGCPERLKLWKEYVGSPWCAAARWGIDPGDAERARLQYQQISREG